MNVEEDEAGRLRAFRAKFGRGWDSEVTEDLEEVLLPRVLSEYVWYRMPWHVNSWRRQEILLSRIY